MMMTVVGALVIAVLAQGAEPPRSVRIYVFDCGTLENMDAARFQLKKEEVSTNRMSVSCFLVAHPKGTMIWDTGAVPDTAWKPARTQ
jgi:N-acyl homoserine lactone hydrolase